MRCMRCDLIMQAIKSMTCYQHCQIDNRRYEPRSRRCKRVLDERVPKYDFSGPRGQPTARPLRLAFDLV